jgi:hypothetical protein
MIVVITNVGERMMNERIRELMNQAMESTGIEGLGGSYMELNPEKFAELIVRECSNWLKQPVNQTPSCGVTMNIAADRLKEHFGVE